MPAAYLLINPSGHAGLRRGRRLSFGLRGVGSANPPQSKRKAAGILEE
jgi:hypothetical protein